MQETEKYKLKKPSTEDFFNIEDFNENTDKIEQALKENAENLDLKIADVNNNFGDIKPHAFLEQISEEYLDNIITEKINNAIQKRMIANNLTTTNPEMVLAAPMGKELKRQLDEQKNNKLNKTEFDNLQIGGRNLAKETNQGSKNWGWSLGTGSVTVESETIDSINCVKLTKTQDVSASGWNYVCYKNFERNKIKPSTEYILSFEVKSNKISNIDAHLTLLTAKDYLTETCKVIKGKVEGNDTWTKVVFLLKTYSELPTSTGQVIYLRGFNPENGAIHYIRNLMLEEGTKPTDWTPAPEDVQDQINNVQNPTFDDSGTTEGINSFTDFMNSVKSKMSIFDFFKNFKAGMKYVLHTGKLVNNATTTQEGFALDARMGKTLQDQITEQNKNINFSISAEDSASSLEEAIKSVWEKLPRDRYFSGSLWYNGVYTIYGFVYSNADYGAVTAFSYAHPLLTVKCVNNNFSSEKYVTNSDLPKLYYRIEDTQNAGNPTEAIKNKWATMPDGNYICEIYVGSVHTALVQKIENGNYGSVYIISYGSATPLYIRKVLESWIVK